MVSYTFVIYLFVINLKHVDLKGQWAHNGSLRNTFIWSFECVEANLLIENTLQQHCIKNHQSIVITHPATVKKI